MEIYEARKLLNEFLERWPIEVVENMTLQEYVSVGNKDTFCQWVETKTRELGSIKGLTSIKFGIYERQEPDEMPKNYENDDKYSWLKGYGTNKNEAFQNVKEDIIKIIKLSEKGSFDKIDDIILPNLFKWKVAFLYSNERLIPIYKKEVLHKIGSHFGLNINRNTKISEIQNIMILNKPVNKDVHSFMWELYDIFGSDKEKENIQAERNKLVRTSAKSKNTTTQIRNVNISYTATQKHNKIQEALRKRLIEEYGESNVILEENYVDVKVVQPEYLNFYEVKSSSYANECIREALGQILLYSYNDNDKREKRIYVVGQYPANEHDIGYINYIKKNLNLKFEYIFVDI